MVQVEVALSQPVPTTIASLTPGLLVFFDRPSWLQSWAERFGHEWRHVGITVETKQGLMVANYARRAKYHYLPVKKLANYRRIGIASVFSTKEEHAALARWCDHFEAQPTESMSYSTSSPLVGSLHLYARSLSNGRIRSAMMAVTSTYCRMQSRRYRDRPAYICSTFACSTVQAARATPLRIPMTAHPDDHVSYATAPTALDAELARWFCAPSHLWSAISLDRRADLCLDEDGVGIPEEIREHVPSPEPASARSKRVPALLQPIVAVATVLRLVNLKSKQLLIEAR